MYDSRLTNYLLGSNLLVGVYENVLIAFILKNYDVIKSV